MSNLKHLPGTLKVQVDWLYDDIQKCDPKLADRFLDLLNLACQGAEVAALKRACQIVNPKTK